MMVVTIAEIDRAQLLKVQKRSSKIALDYSLSNNSQTKNMKLHERKNNLL